MFEVIFGIIWLLITGVVTFAFYCSGTPVTVNGTLVSHDVFSAMLLPKIFLGIFWIIGFWVLFKGLKRIIKDYLTEKNGEICYGIIRNISQTGASVNGIPQLKALLSVYLESTGNMEEIEEIIGLAIPQKYQVGDYVECIYYNGDINIKSAISEEILPNNLTALFKNFKKELLERDTILVNGIEYVKKDSIKDLL